jgi:hypothetical protein
VTSGDLDREGPYVDAVELPGGNERQAPLRPGNEGKVVKRAGGDGHQLGYWAGDGPPFAQIWQWSHDTTDWALDVIIEPDGRWGWKDEDDFAAAQRLGIPDAAAATAVREEGRRVIAQRPWPTGWEGWRPPERVGAAEAARRLGRRLSATL